MFNSTIIFVSKATDCFFICAMKDKVTRRCDIEPYEELTPRSGETQVPTTLWGFMFMLVYHVSFTFLQNINQCTRGASFIVCTQPFRSGFGSFVHRNLFCFLVAYYTKRKLVMDANGYKLFPEYYDMYQRFGFISTKTCVVSGVVRIPDSK